MFKRKTRPQAVAQPRRDSPPLTDSTPADEDNIRRVSDFETVLETLEELIALRKLKRATGGIDLERLNAGEKKKRRKVVDAEGKVTEDGMIEGTHGGIKDRTRDDPDDDPSNLTNKIVRSNNFTGQTNAVDVDKHMMAYIEEELKKRKGTTGEIDTEKEIRSLDPRDALYKIAEKYRIEKKPEQEEEGNVALSAAMLSAIPEVDLGIDRKLKNIEETEKAKRALFEQKQAAAAARADEDEFAVDRFYKARRPLESDADALAKARREAAGDHEPSKNKPMGAGRRETATDDQTMARFKQRQRK
ncbi:hepatocellular carcinoma-associated antigen 59-domain-containing protein [Leucosporidium creatinivorum]|uniref:Hepatocellular carcinoma-associated antigen 59-domain-containing protein n=1 Tax=Leucosporidium creatinivorum TaxID=106004 RepID=A0A1Y2G1L1_9BASI|nr:hepatocellular carcinoma-associated antigen 59-domain-containing protein [Leucosporidium creatinivorum]